MKSLDQTSSLFWLLVSVLVFVEAIRLGVGSVHSPDMGFMTFGASGILGILSLYQFIRASLRKGDEHARAPFAGTFWKRVVFVILALVVYARVMPLLGYLISTFLLMMTLYGLLERKKIWLVFTASFVTTLFTYVVFSKWLSCQFPEGLFGF